MTAAASTAIERVQKFELPLSADCVAVLLFDGAAPDARCFANLRAFIVLVETALLNTPPGKVAKNVKPPPKPCVEHPDAPRTIKSYCSECLKNQAGLMVAARIRARKLRELRGVS